MFTFKIKLDDKKPIRADIARHTVMMWVFGVYRFIDTHEVKDKNHAESNRNERKN